MTIIEVFADVACPFTHVGLRRFVQRRLQTGRTDVKLRVRAWPLEIVNGEPLDPHFIAEEVDDIRSQIAPELFAGFSEAAFPVTSIPSLALAGAAYEQGLDVGELVSLELRDLLFEQGINIAEPAVLTEVAARFQLREPSDGRCVLDDHAEGVRRGVIGSPHFFTPAGDLFCPALDVSRDSGGSLHIAPSLERFESFMTMCFQ